MNISKECMNTNQAGLQGVWQGDTTPGGISNHRYECYSVSRLILGAICDLPLCQHLHLPQGRAHA